MNTYHSKEQILNYLKSIKGELEGDGITTLGLFGSYARDEADMASDIDIVICTSKDFVDRHSGFGGVIYLDELRQKLAKNFKTQVDICDIASMSQERQSVLLQGVIYV